MRFVLAAVLLSGCYNPGVADCVYSCNNGACPSGLSCVANMCTAGTDCSAAPVDGSGVDDAMIDSDTDHAECGDHLTYRGGEFCFHDIQIVQTTDTVALKTPQFGDWDGDKNRDIVLLQGNNLRWWPGNGDGTWESGTRVSQLPDSFQRFLVEDFNGDGYDDWVFAGSESYHTYVGQAGTVPKHSDDAEDGANVVGIVAGTFVPQAANTTTRSVAIGYQQSVLVISLDTDMNFHKRFTSTIMSPDKVFGIGAAKHAPYDYLAAAAVNEIKNLDYSVEPPAPAPAAPGQMTPFGFGAGDFDGDGITDYVEVDATGNMTVTFGALVGNPPQHAQTQSGFSGIKTSIAVGNFDGDKFDDFAVVSPGATSDILVFRGSANFSLTPVEPKPNAGFIEGDWITARDFNGDSIDDLIIHGQNSGAISVLLSNP